MPGNVQHSSVLRSVAVQARTSASYRLLLVRVHGGTFERLAVGGPGPAHARTLAVRPARGCCSCVQLCVAVRAARACCLTDRAPRHLSASLSFSDHLASDGHVRHFRVRTWNATVANLTLMALGSSAPNPALGHRATLQRVVQRLSRSVDHRRLGRVQPLRHHRRLRRRDSGRRLSRDAQPRVYAVTAFFSVFAYVWLVIVLLGTTPEIVDLPEAILTLFFFPLVVWMAYVVEKWSTSPKFKEKWSKRFGLKHEEASAEELLPSTVLLDVKHPDGSPLSADELLTMVKRLRRTATGLAVSEEKVVSVIAQQMASQQLKWRVPPHRGHAQDCGREGPQGAKTDGGLHPARQTFKGDREDRARAGQAREALARLSDAQRGRVGVR